VGLNQPYRAPVYQTYGECVRGLYRQGILGFYKGNGCRLAHIYLYEVHRTWFQQFLDRDETILKRTSFVKDFLASLVTSCYLHFLHIMEARFIINNRIPSFQSYKSTYSMLTTLGMQYFNGMSVYFPRTLILSLTGFNYFSSANF